VRAAPWTCNPIVIANGPSFNLPGDVFKDGEVRPTKLKKKTAAAAATANGAAVASNKRNLTDAGLDVSDNRVAKANRVAA